MAKIQIFIKMKKTILLLLGFMSAGIFAQSQHTIEMTEKSNDPKEATRILNGSNKGNSAYVTVKNLSKCPIVVNFTGKSSYNISVPANSTGRMSLNKGSYTISSVVCGGNYQQSRTINADYQLTLGVK